MTKLKPKYYQNPDVIFLAQDLLGKILFTQKNGEITAGIITETEAYFGEEDKASHAYGGKRTLRTEAMFQTGGFSYIYLCYGIHHLFNIVVSHKNDPKSVLVRAVEPFEGLSVIESRRRRSACDKTISSGPGSVCKALGIDMTFNKKPLTGEEIWIEDSGLQYSQDDITSTPRIGVAYAREHAALPLRFYLKNNRYISKK
ncbi:DNA-3-methyladenine glycosylase [Chryseobacterium profundimaris]|uniref:Putative 3-methyladenine DNA glycosylase n=1 Tax=Chryseobacterium profundimaris TaxID=1387275 RepID=A0ABY1PJV9_9FLAO|nr:DNA-3-methyladenine glycosylase [Chryseobacterium profundimaris]SMP35281.1 DNA-3-methyladenine glycosylase [Chryseobacterium profundimaris]